jgi:hypothetical protein
MDQINPDQLQDKVPRVNARTVKMQKSQNLQMLRQRDQKRVLLQDQLTSLIQRVPRITKTRKIKDLQEIKVKESQSRVLLVRLFLVLRMPIQITMNQVPEMDLGNNPL